MVETEIAWDLKTCRKEPDEVVLDSGQEPAVLSHVEVSRPGWLFTASNRAVAFIRRVPPKRKTQHLGACYRSRPVRRRWSLIQAWVTC